MTINEAYTFYEALLAVENSLEVQGGLHYKQVHINEQHTDFGTSRGVLKPTPYRNRGRPVSQTCSLQLPDSLSRVYGT